MTKNHKIQYIFAAISLLSVSCSSSNVEFKIENFEVPSAYREEMKENAGKIETLTYKTKDYILSSGKEEEKKLNVYLPYNYDSSKEYNIIYLIHGTDAQNVDHINTWFNTVGVKNILDNLIYQNLIDPLIVVTPTFYSYGLYGDDTMKNIKDFSPVKQYSSENFIHELRNDIIPNVEGQYSTFAKDVSVSSLQNSRRHRALAGLSNGARITLNGGLVNNFDYFSNFGCFSSSIDANTIIEALNKEENANLEIDSFVNVSGIYDFAYNSQKKMVNALKSEERFKDKISFYEVLFGAHKARTWRVGFYDALQCFFKE